MFGLHINLPPDFLPLRYLLRDLKKKSGVLSPKRTIFREVNIKKFIKSNFLLLNNIYSLYQLPEGDCVLKA